MQTWDDSSHSDPKEPHCPNRTMLLSTEEILSLGLLLLLVYHNGIQLHSMSLVVFVLPGHSESDRALSCTLWMPWCSCCMEIFQVVNSSSFSHATCTLLLSSVKAECPTMLFVLFLIKQYGVCEPTYNAINLVLLVDWRGCSLRCCHLMRPSKVTRNDDTLPRLCSPINIHDECLAL